MSEIPAIPHCHARTGVESSVLTQFFEFCSRCGFLGTLEDLILVAECAKQGFTWAAGAYYLHKDRASVSTHRRRVLRTLKEVDRLIFFNLDLQDDLTLRHEEFPLVNGTVDCAPVVVDKNDDTVSGKYKLGVIKFEAWVTTKDARPFWLRGPFVGKDHDSKILRTEDNMLPHKGNAVYLGDKAYGGFSHLLVPRKSSKHHPITEDDKNFEKLHSLARARSEHFFARLHKFAVCRNSELEDVNIALFYQFCAKLEAFRMGSDGLVDAATHARQVLARTCACGFKNARDRERDVDINSIFADF